MTGWEPYSHSLRLRRCPWPLQQAGALIEPNSLMDSACISSLHLEVFKKPVVNYTDINLL